VARLDEVLNKASPTQEDHDWFEQHYPEVREGVRHYLSYKLGDFRGALDDVEHVVMVRVWLDGRTKHKAETTSKEWIFGVAKLEALNHIQSEKAKAKTARATFGQLKLRWMIQAHEELWSYQRWTFAEIMDCLAPEHQEVLILRIYYRMSARDAALTLGRRRATVDEQYEAALIEARRWIEYEDVRDLPDGEDGGRVLRERAEPGWTDLDVQEVLQGQS
jgi:DNA-directed RNA polymerase specialized sigma24 family protein